MRTSKIFVEPKVIRWARRYRNFDRSHAAKLLGIEKAILEKIEEGLERPTKTLFKKMSKKYNLPEATLLMPEAPEIPTNPADFRTLPEKEAVFSVKTILAISRLQSYQGNLIELLQNDPKTEWIKLSAYSNEEDPSEIATNERIKIGFSIEEQLNWPDSKKAFKKFRKIIEINGVCVFQDKFPMIECRGFSVFDNLKTPLIMLNRNEYTEESKIFTLAHEYGHLLIRKPGISNLDDRNPIEKFCNQFAAAFLMPVELLRIIINPWPNSPEFWPQSKIKEWAQTIKVSQQSLALRLEQLGLAPIGYFNWFENQQAHLERKKKKVNGGNAIRTQLSTLGTRYVTNVLNSTARGVLDPVNASRLLNLPPRSFGKLREFLLA